MLLTVGLIIFGLIFISGDIAMGDTLVLRNWNEGGLLRTYRVPRGTGEFWDSGKSLSTLHSLVVWTFKGRLQVKSCSLVRILGSQPGDHIRIYLKYI